MVICNCFHEKLANDGKIKTFWGYCSLMPLCAGFLEPRKSRLGPLKFTFNAENFIYSLSMSIFIDFGAIHSWNVSRSPKLPKIHKKTLSWRSRIIQGHWNRWQSRTSVRLRYHCTAEKSTFEFALVNHTLASPSFGKFSSGVKFHLIFHNREPVYDFLLVINSNLGPVSHHCWDIANYWLKIANFPTPFSFSALVWGDLFRIYGKAFRFLKLESSRQPTVKI